MLLILPVHAAYAHVRSCRHPCAFLSSCRRHEVRTSSNEDITITVTQQQGGTTTIASEHHLLTLRKVFEVRRISQLGSSPANVHVRDRNLQPSCLRGHAFVWSDCAWNGRASRTQVLCTGVRHSPPVDGPCRCPARCTTTSARTSSARLWCWPFLWTPTAGRCCCPTCR